MNNYELKNITDIYPQDEKEYQKIRYEKLIQNFNLHFNNTGSISLFSSPGRTELGGNHTDHNHGKVLAAAVNLDTIAAASPNRRDTVNIYSEGYDPISVDISSLDKIQIEEETTEAIIRGIAAGFRNRGLQVGGFNAEIKSDVPPGSGLSSSASIEMLITYIFSKFFNGNSVSIVDSARISKFAENEYFNKPSGLMDQIACGYGGIVSIDFKEEGNEIIDPVKFSFKNHGYTLAVIKTDSDHADLTDEYSFITEEMGKISSFFGKKVLREIDENEFYKRMNDVRKEAGDRAVLRALHFFNENSRVDLMKNTLKKNAVEEYLETVISSGNSSFKYLQNVYPSSSPVTQATSLALAMTENFLSEKSSIKTTADKSGSDIQGACRIHGGGFAGTVQVYVENDIFNEYNILIENVFGQNSVVPLEIRNSPGGFITDI